MYVVPSIFFKYQRQSLSSTDVVAGGSHVKDNMSQNTYVHIYCLHRHTSDVKYLISWFEIVIRARAASSEGPIVLQGVIILCAFFALFSAFPCAKTHQFCQVASKWLCSAPYKLTKYLCDARRPAYSAYPDVRTCPSPIDAACSFNFSLCLFSCPSHFGGSFLCSAH